MHANRSLKPAELSSSQRRLEIIPQPLAELKPDPANPRRHSKKQIRQIAKSISVFGFNMPVLVDAELNVIAGHGRLLACRELGIDEVPTLCLDHLTPVQVRAFRIADNKLTENATWDERLLGEQLRDLSLSGLDFDIEVTGFEIGEIDLLIHSLEDTPAAGSDPADILPESPSPAMERRATCWRSTRP
jgi:ParB-like chromosome segregation protein Spo0J